MTNVETLQQGSTGEGVKMAQEKLKTLGFSPGAIDGDFGPGTEAAVLAFQRSERLMDPDTNFPNGLLDAATQARLFGQTMPDLEGNQASDLRERVTVNLVSHVFPTTPLTTIKEHLPHVLDALAQHGLNDNTMVAMVLGTIAAECGKFQPADEGVSRYNTSPGGEAFDLYEHRKDLGNTQNGDGARYHGRGWPQLTGRANYAFYEPYVDAPIVAQPNLVMGPRVGAELLALFLKHHETAIRRALAKNDLATARRLYNGGAHGLTEFTKAYNRAMSLLLAQKKETPNA